jgi:hypothetical protein
MRGEPMKILPIGIQSFQKETTGYNYLTKNIIGGEKC